MNNLKSFLLLFLFSLSFSHLTFAQGIEFFHGTFAEALELAKKEDKAIFVDAYTTWCGPCKRMSKYVFTEQKVGDYYNSTFINMKLDMEKEEGMKFGLKYPVSAYPTFYFIKPDGEVLFTTKGGRQPAQFVELGQKAMSKYDDVEDLADQYAAGERDAKFIHRYVKALSRNGESPLKVANDYLNAQSDLTTLENLAIIQAATVEADSKIFEHYVNHKDGIINLSSKEAYIEHGKKACEATVKKAVEYKTPELLEEAQKAYSQLPVDDASTFELTSNMSYYSAAGDGKQYVKSAKKYLKKHVGNDAKKMNEVVGDVIANFKEDPDVMDFAESFAKKAAEYGGLSEYYLNLAYTHYYQKEYDQSLTAAEKALELAAEEKANPSPMRALIKKLEQM